MATVTMDIAEFDALRVKVEQLEGEKRDLLDKLAQTEKVVVVRKQSIKGKISFPVSHPGGYGNHVQVTTLTVDYHGYGPNSQYYNNQLTSLEDLVRRGLVKIEAEVVPSETVESYQNLESVVDGIKAKLEADYAKRFEDLKITNEQLSDAARQIETTWIKKYDELNTQTSTAIKQLNEELAKKHKVEAEITEIENVRKALSDTRNELILQNQKLRDYQYKEQKTIKYKLKKKLEKYLK